MVSSKLGVKCLSYVDVWDCENKRLGWQSFRLIRF